MTTSTSERANLSCRSGCRHCGAEQASASADGGEMYGWRLTVSSLAVFLLPLLAAAAGAGLCGAIGQAWQLGGALVGLLAGIAAGVVLARWVRRTEGRSR